MLPPEPPTSAHSWKRTLYIISLAQLVCMVGFSSMFPFLPLYVRQLGSRFDISIDLLTGLVYSSHALTMMVAAPVWGALADRFGRKLMVERAMFGGAAVLALMPFAPSAEALVLLRALQGMITGVIGAANALVAGAVPRHRLGFGMGMLQVSMGLGLSLGPMLGGAIADGFGYAAVFYTTGGLLLLGGVLVWLGVREQFVPPRDTQDTPPSFRREWGNVLRSTGIPLAYFLRFLNYMGRMIFMPVAPLFVASLMTGPAGVNTVTGLLVGLSSAAMSVSAVTLGRLGDRLGHRPVLAGSALGAAIFFVPQALVHTHWQLLALHTVAGAFLGGIVPAVSALLAQYTRPGEEGAVYGLDSSISSAGRALGPMLGVWIVMVFGLRAAFGATAVIYLIIAGVAYWGLPAAGGEAAGKRTAAARS